MSIMHLAIDVETYFYEDERLFRDIRRTADDLLDRGIPTIWVAYNCDEFHFKLSPDTTFIEHITDALIDALDFRETPVHAGETAFVKYHWSAFDGSRFADILKFKGIDHVILSGLFARSCVLSTALDAIEHGFKCTVLCDKLLCELPSLRAPDTIKKILRNDALNSTQKDRMDQLDLVTDTGTFMATHPKRKPTQPIRATPAFLLSDCRAG